MMFWLEEMTLCKVTANPPLTVCLHIQVRTNTVMKREQRGNKLGERLIDISATSSTRREVSSLAIEGLSSETISRRARREIMRVKPAHISTLEPGTRRERERSKSRK